MDEINILAATAAAAPNHCDGDSPVVCILGVSSDFFWNHFCSMWPSVSVDNAHVAHAHGEHFELSAACMLLLVILFCIFTCSWLLVNSCSGKDDTVLMVELQTKNEGPHEVGASNQEKARIVNLHEPSSKAVADGAQQQ